MEKFKLYASKEVNSKEFTSMNTWILESDIPPLSEHPYLAYERLNKVVSLKIRGAYKAGGRGWTSILDVRTRSRLVGLYSSNCLWQVHGDAT